jgi:hypothetical protein
MTFRISHRFSWNSRKKVPHTTKFFGILPDNRQTKYPQNYSTKCYYYYYLSTAKTSLTDNKKKMTKVFLWRPTWAHFHLELFWQFVIEDRFFGRSQDLGRNSELPCVQRKVTPSPLARSIGCFWTNSDSLSFTNSNYIPLSDRSLQKNFPPRFRSPFVEPSIGVKISEFGRPSEDQKPRKTNGQKHFSLEENPPI